MHKTDNQVSEEKETNLMNNNLLFITFYTIDTIYESALREKLLPSLQKLGLTYFLRPIKNKGYWYLNTIEKPTTILQALNKFQSDLVWIDSDAEIKSFPTLLFKIPQEYDIAVHYLSWEKHFGRPTDKGKFEMLDGTIFVRNNEKMKQFIEQWKANSTDKGINHQKVLARMLKERPDIKVFKLPWEYTYIATTPWGLTANPIKNIVIEHYQLSRKGKRCLRILQ